MDAERSDPEDIGVNRSSVPTIGELIEAQLSRRALLRGLGAAAGAAGLLSPGAAALAQIAAARSSLAFGEVPHGSDERHHVAPGYSARVLLAWGDPVTADAPPFDPARQSAGAQARQFGYNADFLAFMALPRGSGSSERGLLCVNHEYANEELMFPGFSDYNDLGPMTAEQVAIDLAAHGLSVVEIARENGVWAPRRAGRYNRRLTAGETVFRLSGPAAGHARLRTSGDPTGTRVLGTLNNCAGGVTPWGTVLSGEENFNGYFRGDAAKTPEAANHRRYGVMAWRNCPWGNFVERFNVEKEPNEPNRFGWVVEYDPYDRNSTPVKRTALGRFKHEGATVAIARDGRVVVYSGDDERFEYVYRFVSQDKYQPGNRAANLDLLDRGTLSVATFHDDGRLAWLPLIWGQGPLTPANGFASQADVLIEARRAADLLGATPMDRPEDVEPDPVTGRVYVVLTNNDRRKAAGDANPRERANAANPRAGNRSGHILELIPPGGAGTRADHAADEFRWEIFLLAGNPANPQAGARYGAGVSPHGWLAAPDNLAFDKRGRVWIATDGMPSQAEPPAADALYGADTRGPGRALTRRFFSAPRGAEICGPTFTPDAKTLFLAVQHPAEERGSTYETPSTRWPDFKPNIPPRPAVMVITKDDGGEIGS